MSLTCLSEPRCLDVMLTMSKVRGHDGQPSPKQHGTDMLAKPK
jgi:hypothetical protein